MIIPANSSKTYEKQLVPKVLSGELPRRCTDGKKYFCGGGKVPPDHPPNLGFGWEWLKFDTKSKPRLSRESGSGEGPAPLNSVLDSEISNEMDLGGGILGGTKSYCTIIIQYSYYRRHEKYPTYAISAAGQPENPAKKFWSSTIHLP